MGRNPCCSKEGMTKGAWTLLEDKILTDFIKKHGEGQWRSLPKKAGLKRCGKSCRLRWLNYLRPDIKRGNISSDEEELIIRLHNLLGNRWSLIAGRLPGRTDNEIKNYWNTTLGKRHLRQAADNPQEHRPRTTTKNRRPSAGASRPRPPALLPPPVTQPSHVVVRAKAVRCTKAVAVAVSTRTMLHKSNNFNDNTATTSEGLFNHADPAAAKPQEAGEAPPFFGETTDDQAIVPFLEMDLIGSDPGDPIPLPDLLTDYSSLSELMGCDSEYFNYCNVNNNDHHHHHQEEETNNAEYIQTTPSSSSPASTYSSDEPLVMFSQELMEDWLGRCP